MSDRVKITFFSLNDNPNDYVRATLGIHIISMDMFLSKIKLVRKKDGTFYVAPPSEEYTNAKSGNKEFANFWWFGKKSEDFFQKEVMKAIDTYCFDKKIKNPIYENTNTT